MNSPKRAISQSEFGDEVGGLYQALNDAYWAASTIESKDRIRGTQDLVFDILTALTRADIKSRSADYQSLKGQFQTAQERLEKLKGDIDQIIHAVKIATKVTDAIGRVVAMAAKFFA